MNPTSLTRAAALAAAVAGVLFIAVQINHPAMDVASVTTTEWAIRNIAKVVLSALALAGITGMYLRQIRPAGVLGLVGYLLFSVGFLAMLSIAFVAATVLPTVAGRQPAYVQDVLDAAAGGSATGDIGLIQPALLVSAAGYLLGGLLFGVALFRARVLARWAAALLAAGTAGTVALQVLPQSFERPFAVPTGVALIGLGLSLWRHPRADRTPVAPIRHTEPATAR
ncbi:hypothetical protein [Paractinoplanes durhamensis]|uniref:DUF4386 family protein n=1 Tax=Paractinoplanes durhamensis TaxID=113563 RepID=A0ABQ3YW14_9ACTN|nr:hypothetical protein [Actinoplanes durhamensis]GIE01689.1 hypothetical protein Adu01nite_30390 [Actinoplanes durhamensis]